jgi:hypothetical protein
MAAKSWTTVPFHKCKRSNKPDRQREDGQAIFKADSSSLVCNETPDKAFHRAGPP